jgi:hypothetical protein
MQVAQAIMPDDRITCNQFSVTTPEKPDEDNTFLRKIKFSDEATFHNSGKAKTQNTWSAGQNALMLHCSVLQAEPQLTSGVACSTII